MFQILSIVGILGVILAIILHRSVFGKSRQFVRRFGLIDKGIFAVVLICVLLLMITGQMELRGWILMFHVSTGGVLIAFMALWAILWAGACRFGITSAKLPRFTFGEKVCFWLILALSLPVIGTVMLSMLPVFGTHGQELLVEIHEYSGLALFLLSFFCFYLVVANRRKASTG